MKFSSAPLLSLATIPLLVAAHSSDPLAVRRAHQERQAPPASSPAASTGASVPAAATSTGSVPAPASSGASAPAGTGSAAVSSALSAPATTFSFSLQSTNPTAVPLSDIVATAATSATSPLDSTAAPGSTPTFLPGAPPLPDASLLHPTDYPALDKPPPTDHPLVQQWMQELNNSGVNIPNIAPTVAGGCPANPQAATDSSRCWWTCGGCTRDTDITECPTAMEWGLTYDDGPAFYTSDLLSYLDQQNLKSTFFVVGSRVISFPNILQTQYMGQHQIAVHTWSHPSLTTLSNEEIVAELGWSKKVIKDVLGVTPNMMRPPFGDIDDRVRAISLAMGLTPVMWTRISPLATFDTDDFNIHGGTTSVQQVLHNWENILGNATTRDTGFIVLEHDLFQQTVEVATGYILPDALAHQPKFDIKPVISCLKKDLSDAYIETNNNSTNPPVSLVGTATVAGGTGAASGASQPTKGSDSNANNSNGAVTLGANVVSAAAGLVAGLAAIVL